MCHIQRPLLYGMKGIELLDKSIHWVKKLSHQIKIFYCFQARHAFLLSDKGIQEEWRKCHTKSKFSIALEHNIRYYFHAFLGEEFSDYQESVYTRQPKKCYYIIFTGFSSTMLS